MACGQWESKLCEKQVWGLGAGWLLAECWSVDFILVLHIKTWLWLSSRARHGKNGVGSRRSLSGMMEMCHDNDWNADHRSKIMALAWCPDHHSPRLSMEIIRSDAENTLWPWSLRVGAEFWWCNSSLVGWQEGGFGRWLWSVGHQVNTGAAGGGCLK